MSQRAAELAQWFRTRATVLQIERGALLAAAAAAGDVVAIASPAAVPSTGKLTFVPIADPAQPRPRPLLIFAGPRLPHKLTIVRRAT
jgi:hypothetical protein